jgi:D-alanyl-D-alanine dipeptidase
MRSVEGYRWGLVVEHNADAPVPGRGSCIFLHIWAGPEKGTAGCTAMEQTNLEELLRWLDSKKLPLLVQLPEGEYTRLRTAWRLPRLDGK